MRPWNKRRRLLLQWSIVTTLILGATIAWSLASRSPDEEAVLPGAQVEGLTSVLTREASGASIPIRFEDVTDRSGVRFRHFPAERASLLPEDMGSGVAVGDYDADGYPDLFFVNFSGNLLHEHPFDADDGSARLYRNVNGDHFEDVTDHAGLGLTGYGMGAAWGDFDNDGDLDLYVTTFGPNVLYENLGNGRFKDVTAQAGVQDGRFSAGCSWADYDRDGDLDLYVCNYVNFVFREADRDRIERQYATEQPYTLNPSAYRPQPNSLFRNNGDGTFEEVALSAGVADETGRSLSASWVDFDNDGWPDLYTAVVTMRDGKVYPAIYRNLGAAKGGLPKFQETAFVHRRDFPGKDDLVPGKTRFFYEKLVANRKVMYFAPGPSGDFDNDGRLDIFLPSWWPKFPSMLLKHETPSGGYLDVTVVGPKGVNRMGIGTMVRAYKAGRAGKPEALLASEEISTGYGFCSGQPAVAHLGLGTEATCDLVITLPHGKGRIVRRGVKANQRLRIDERPSSKQQGALR
ncbi:MAG: CRTAC1 family protein [Planctomycetes bacterium]|nr:CRTAC1 family protein [Planctomycetota bacterium]